MADTKRSPTPPGEGRMTLRVISRDRYARVDQIREQEIPASMHDVALFLRRAPFREQIAEAMLAGGSISIERKGSK